MNGGETMAPDRYLIRRVVNDLIDMLIDEGVEREDIIDQLGEILDSDKEYFDINWLYKEN
jgi:hypothetical protein